MTLDKIEHIIKQNMTITDPRLMDAVVTVCLDVAEAVLDEQLERTDADVDAVNEALVVLQVIKDTDPGVYDEVIDKAIGMLTNALRRPE
jgi:hypothetical protein